MGVFCTPSVAQRISVARATAWAEAWRLATHSKKQKRTNQIIGSQKN